MLQAAATPVWACLHRGLEQHSGSYVDDCRLSGLPGSFAVPYRQWKQLWDDTQVGAACLPMAWHSF